MIYPTDTDRADVKAVVELGAFSLWNLAMESRVGAISLMQSGQKIQYLARRIFRETYANELLVGQVAPGKTLQEI